MSNQIQEAANQILIAASDIQAELSLIGSEEANLKLKNIREQAAGLAGEDPVGKIIESYRADINMLIEQLIEGGRKIEEMDDISLAMTSLTAATLTMRIEKYLALKLRIGRAGDLRKAWGRVMYNKINSKETNKAAN